MTNNLMILALATAAACGTVSPFPSDNGDSVAGEPSGSASGTGSTVGSGSGSASRPNTLTGSMYDERDDLIDTSTGELQHVHQGEKLALGGDDCPAIYKYGYLIGPHTFGSENVPNPVAWNFDGDLAAYRVVDDANETVIDWTEQTGGRIELGAPIADKSGKLHLEVRTAQGDVVSTCWNHHPLAPPFVLGIPQQGALFEMKFGAAVSFSPLVNAGSFADSHVGLEVAKLQLDQYLDEVVPVSIEVPTPTGTTIGTIVTTHVARNPRPASYSCGYLGCLNYNLDAATTNTAALRGTWQLALVDQDTGLVICRSQAASPTKLACSLPARTGAVRHFKASLSLAAEPTLAPATVSSLAEDTFADMMWSGWNVPAFNTGSPSTVCIDSDGGYCHQIADDYPYALLDQAAITFGEISFDVNGMSHALPTATWKAGVGN